MSRILQALNENDSVNNVESLKQELEQAKKGFDPNYEYSDDHSYWKKQNEKSKLIRNLEKQIKDAGSSLTEVDKSKTVGPTIYKQVKSLLSQLDKRSKQRIIMTLKKDLQLAESGHKMSVYEILCELQLEGKKPSKEIDYDDPAWDAMVKRVGQMAKEGPRKTVYDPVKRVYKTVPINTPKKEQGVAEAFGPLPKDNKQIRLGRHTVDIERVGLNKNYIGFTWHDSQGREHYEEVPVGDLGSYDDLIKKIKQEISYQERKYTDQGVAEGYDDEDEGNPVMNAIISRIMRTRPDLLDYDMQKLQAAIRDVALDVGDVDEIGSSDISGWVKRVEQNLSGAGVTEAINPDITNPAFSHQQQIGDYLYVARYWSKGLKISAYDGDKQIGYAELMYHSAPFDDFADPKTTPKRVWLESEWTKVNPKYQRQGIMSTMYAYAKMLGNSVKPSELRSPDAKAAWASWRQSGDAKHLTSNESVAEGSDIEYIVVIRDEQGKRSIRVSALTPTDAKEKAQAQGYKVIKVKDPQDKHYFKEQGVAEATGNPGMPHDFTAVQPGVEVWYKGRFAGWTTGKVYDDPYGTSGKMVAFEPNPSEFSGDEGRILSLPYSEVSLRKSTSIGKLKGPGPGVAEGSGPKEKQKTPYRDINSAEYRAAADKQKQQMAKDKLAEPGKKLLAKKGVAEVSDATKQSYKAKAQAQVKELEPHAKKGEYKDIAQRAIDRRTKGLSRLKQES